MTLPALIRSNDRKVTNGVSPNGKTATIANAFGLPSGKAFSCPGATNVCERVCYAGRLEKIYSGVKRVLLHNWDALQGRTVDEMVSMLGAMIDDFRADCIKANAKRAKRDLPPVKMAFRIHWDGDFFSVDYARAWARVIVDNPGIHFWVYTRSFTSDVNVVPVFAMMPGDVDNFSLYLSVDGDNREIARDVRADFPTANFAELAETFADGRDALAEAAKGRAVYNCPENGGRIPLISEKGSACIRCGICVEGRGDVIFSIKKR